VRRALLWAQINWETASYAEKRVPDRYLRVKYESLCSDPRPTITRILRFLGVEDAGLDEQMLREVEPPDSIGRWRKMGDPSLMHSICSVVGEELRFG
jgi:hypothetical protein